MAAALCAGSWRVSAARSSSIKTSLWATTQPLRLSPTRMRARHDRRGGVGARRGDQLVAVEDAHAGRLGLEQPARLVDDQGEHLLRVVDRRQVSRNLVQRLQALAIAVRLAEE